MSISYFAKINGAGRDLWVTDGTVVGTHLVVPFAGGITTVTAIGGRAYLVANDGLTGDELWTSDGTAAGTMLVKDINPDGNSLDSLTNVNGTLFFQANDGIVGSELWKSDGTAVGTVLVKDIRPDYGSNPAELTNVNGTLFFADYDGPDGGHDGYELWKSDGTAAGTVLVKDINPGDNSSSPADLVNVDGTLFFRADDGTHPFGLWKSDGTADGTVLLKDFNPGAGHTFPLWLTNVNGTLFFLANDGVNGFELWKSDGTADGTALVKDIYPGAGGSFPAPLTNVNGTLYFGADDGTHGQELWKSDGTAAGTVMVKDINPAANGSSPSYLTNVNGTLFFAAADPTHGVELWKSDGTAAGTVMVQDINPGTGDSSPATLTNVNGLLEFYATTDGGLTFDLYRSDGTAAGTFELATNVDRNTPIGFSPVPTITSNGGGDTAAVSIAENTTAVTTVTATDPDVGQTLSYSIIGGADASKFTIGSSTGALSFVTAPNFEAPTDAGGNNVYDVIAQASDGYGGSDTQAIAVTVTDVSENIVPGNFSLTPGADTVVAPSSGSTVYATSATLNAGDSLTGGAGTDVLALVGGGTFRVDQLATFTGFERITLDNATNSSAQLVLGGQPIEVDATGYLNIQVNSPSNWNGSDIINGDASYAWMTNIGFSNNQGIYPPLPVTYDLTSNTFSHVNIYGNADNITLLINNADTAGVQSFGAGGLGDKLVTAGSTLDLSHTTVSGFTVASTNGLGTTFTVSDLGTAFQIAGGSGHDTIVATGFTLTAAQRTEIFATNSIETITDQTGTYAAPAPSPGVVGLTPGADTVVAPSSGSTVYATSATLNAGDSLTGGAGTDVLALVGGGTFRVDQLATFTGFERITLDNATNSSAQLVLGGQPIEVDATGYLNIQVNSPSNWNGSDIINGDASYAWMTNIGFSNNQGIYPPLPVTYDLTSNTFSHVNIYGNADNITLLINNADTAGVQSFGAGGLGDKLVTAGSTLDLSHTTVSGFTVASTNGLGTTFTVSDLGTAFQIAGGSGHDTIVATGFTLTAAQRTEIFATNSIETITDQTGTYAAPAPSPGVVGLTPGADTVVAPSSGSTVYATSATLNAGDSLTGGAGTDVLALVGGGTFRVDQLATFTGFERITLDNATNSSAQLVLGGQPIEVDATGYLNIQVNSPSNWNGSDIINGDASYAWMTNIGFSNNQGIYPPLPVTYDLTSNTFSHVNIYGNADNITLLINNADTAGVQSFGAGGLGDKLVTAGSTLDLSHTTVSGFTVASTNGLGTTFTVSDLGTAFQIAGGSGHDTIVATGFTLTAAQRTEIFATNSIETITDQTGTYAATPQNPNVFTLTTGSDTVIGTAGNDTVYATAATLNAGDSLTGGAGTDTLVLNGSGTYRVDQLATFTGFENITLNNLDPTLGQADLYLGSQSVGVTGYGAGREAVILGSGAVAFQGGSGVNYVYSDSASNWNAGNSIDGGSQGTLSLGEDWYANAVYDLTTNTLSNINVLVGYGANLTVKINSSVAGGIADFFANETTASRLVTSDAALDLSHSSVRGFTVASSNTTGTIFTVHDIDTAFQVTGGSGTDTLTAQGFVFTADQRNAIFANASVERIVDTSGTYIAIDTPPTITTNGGADTAAISILENSTAVTTVTATDPDIGQTLSYSITGGADASKFIIDTSTGALSFVTAPNFELPTDAGHNNVYDVTVQASDGYGGVDNQAIAVTVTDVFENTAPIITSNGGGHTAAISLAENTTAVTTVTATDPDVGQTLSYSISGGADASKFKIGSSTGALSFVTAPNFEAPTDAGGNNVYDVIVQASDGHGGIDTQAIAVGVQSDLATPTVPQIHANDLSYSKIHANDLSYSSTASGPNHFIDLLNFEASYPDLVAAFGTNQAAMQNWYNTRESTEHRVETFDGLDYIASYKDLINAFGAAGSMKAVQDDGASHYINNGHNEGRTTTFNGLDYIASYSDLIQAFGANNDAGAFHFIENGHNEGRTTSFNGLDYIASYSDLIHAFGANEQAGAAHFINNGENEGRTTTFNGLDYIASYSDLIHAFGANNDAGAFHFIENGHNEGRTTSFDGLDYIASYSDLIHAFGANEQAGAAHFISNGENEGRTTTFNGLAYIAQYTDLMQAFGANNDAGASHYITNGHNEGRTTAFNVAAYESAHPDLIGKFSSNDSFLTAYIDTYHATGHLLT